jgi:hypothetical protein
MLTVRIYGSRLEAQIAKGLLEAKGVSAFIFADDEGGMAPHLEVSSGVHLKVRKEDYEKAKLLLSEHPVSSSASGTGNEV